MSTFGRKERICATCIYWTGRRSVETVFIETINLEGKCGCSDGFYNLETKERSCCEDWKGFLNLNDTNIKEG